MTWQEANLGLQLLAEERAGFIARTRAEIARGIEDHAFANLAAVAE